MDEQTEENMRNVDFINKGNQKMWGSENGGAALLQTEALDLITSAVCSPTRFHLATGKTPPDVDDQHQRLLPHHTSNMESDVSITVEDLPFFYVRSFGLGVFQSTSLWYLLRLSSAILVRRVPCQWTLVF